MAVAALALRREFLAALKVNRWKRSTCAALQRVKSRARSRLRLNCSLFIYSIHLQNDEKNQLLISLEDAKDVWAAAAAIAAH